MKANIPPIDAIRQALAPLNLKQLDRLGELSGVPPTTIYKIKRGETRDPGIVTCARFMPFVKQALKG